MSSDSPRWRRATQLITSSDRRHARSELKRLERLAPYERTTTSIFDRPFQVLDGRAFVAEHRQIFGDEIYGFTSERTAPSIIDCGANMGLATLYWKQKWPDATVVAFEADPNVFKVLAENCRAFDLTGVTLIQAAVWTEQCTMPFWQEGGAAGRLATGPGTNDRTVEVQTVALADHLTDHVDLLKLDIEGAEVDVVASCASRLHLVERLFVEWHSFADAPQRLHELLAVLAEAGFRVQLHPEVTVTRPFVDRRAYLGMDHQVNVFAFRS